MVSNPCYDKSCHAVGGHKVLASHCGEAKTIGLVHFKGQNHCFIFTL